MSFGVCFSRDWACCYDDDEETSIKRGLIV